MEMTPLHIAAYQGNVDTVETLVANGFNVNGKDENELTPLHCAAQQGNIDVVNVLIKAGSKVDEKENTGMTPLHHAAWEGNVEVVNVLLKAGSKVDEKDHRGSTPLYWAAVRGMSDAVNALLKAGSNVNEKDKMGVTALMCAAQKGNIDVINALVKAGSKVNEKDETEATPLYYAAVRGNVDAINTLVSAGSNVNVKDESGMTPLHRAASQGNSDVVKALIKAGSKVNEKEKNGFTPLDYATKRGDAEMVKALVEAKSKVEVTPLHIAAHQGNVDTVETLVANGFNVNGKDEAEMTPLHIAANKGNVDVVKTLLANGYNVNGKDQERLTPLHYAARQRNADVVNLLVMAGSKVDEKETTGLIPLHYAAWDGHVEVVNVLVKAGSKIDEKNNTGKTPLHGAAFRGMSDAVNALVKAGSNVNETDNMGVTALICAAQNGNIDVLNALVKAGSKVNEKDEKGATPLYYAAVRGDVYAVNTLVSAGSNVNDRDKSGMTPLHRAASQGNSDVVKTLIKAGSKVDEKDKNGFTPLDYATSRGDVEMVKALVEAKSKVDVKDENSYHEVLMNPGVPQTAQTTPSSAALIPLVEIAAGDFDLNEKDVIGEGGQGCVYKAFWKVKQKPVAVKKINLSTNAAKREIETLRSVMHKNIVEFYGVYEISSERFCIVLELAETSLDRHLKKSTPSSETSLNWAQQVGQGMHYLHFDVPEAIIHGDLKSPNVLVYSDSVLKIGDFGSSKFKVGQQSSVTRLTIQWTAPELFDDGKHSMESDIYAFGILLWEMVTHEVPYEGLSIAQIMSRVNKNQRLTIPSFCHETMRRIIQECWDNEPKNRPSFKTILKLLEAANTTETHIKSQKEVAEEEAISKKDPSLMTARNSESDVAYDESQEAVSGSDDNSTSGVPQTPKTKDPSAASLPSGVPTLKLLTNLPVDGMKKSFKIIQKTSTRYNELAMHLLNDDNCDIVDSLKEKCRGNPEEIVTAVYKKWINGAGRQPVTWQTLVGVLKEIELNSLADEIEAALKL